MNNDIYKHRDRLNKNNGPKNPLDKLSSKERHTIWRPYAKDEISPSNGHDKNRESIINRLSEQTKQPFMQIERQTEDMKKDTRERASTKELVLDFLLSERDFPIESTMLQAIPRDKNKKLRFPADQREAQAMKQLIDACYELDKFSTKMKDIEKHLSPLPDDTDNTDNKTVILYSKERLTKKRQILELVKNRFMYIKEFYNLDGLQKTIEDIEDTLKTPRIENDRDSNLELNGDNLAKIWAKHIVADTKYEVKSTLEWQNQIMKYGIFGGPKGPEDWEHASGTGPKDVAKIAREKTKDKINQILPRDSVVRRELVECATTHINRQIDMIEEYEIDEYLYMDSHKSKTHESDYDLDPDLSVDFINIKIEKRKDDET